MKRTNLPRRGTTREVGGFGCHQGDRGDVTKGGDRGEEILADERAHRPVEGSTRGPCGPKNTLTYH